MKIGFVRHSLFNRGGDKVILTYADYLAQRGHEVTIWVNEVDTLFDVSPLIKINFIKFKSKIGTILSTLFVRFPVDVIIADIIPLVSFLTFHHRRKTIYFAQDYDESYYSSPVLKFLTRILYFYALRLLHIPVIAVSDNLGSLFRANFKTEAKVVLNGVDFDKFYPGKDNIIILEKEKKQALLVFMRNDYRKGADIILKLLKYLSEKKFNNHLVVWAIGEKLDVPGLSIKNFGYVNYETLRKILASADVLLFPTRHEGLPLFVLEALACGCPIVTTTAAGVVEDNKDALVSDVEDTKDLTEKLLRLLMDDNLKKRLKEEGFHTVKKYDLNRSKAEFEKSLLDLKN